MANTYYTLVTNLGKAKMANAQVTGEKVSFSKILLGSGKGNPQETQDALIDKKWDGAISNVSVDEDNPNWVVVEAVVPSNVGGFTINEIGLEDEDGDLIVVGNYPETYKPVNAEGTLKDIAIRVIIEVTNADNVTLKVDPSVVIATRKYVDQAIDRAVGDIDFTEFATKAELTSHVDNDDNPHGVTKNQVGLSNVDNVKQASKAEFDDLEADFVTHKAEKASTSKAGHVTLNDSTDSSSTTDAATANAVKKAFDKALGVDSNQVNRVSNSDYSEETPMHEYPFGITMQYVQRSQGKWPIMETSHGVVETYRSANLSWGFQRLTEHNNAGANTIIGDIWVRGIGSNAKGTKFGQWEKLVKNTGTDFTGIVKFHPNTSYTVPQGRNIILSDEEPDGVFGDHGDIWMVYE